MDELEINEKLGLNLVERQRKEIILNLYLYTKPILMQDGERVNLVISRHNTFKADLVRVENRVENGVENKANCLFFFIFSCCPSRWRASSISSIFFFRL